MLNKYKFLDPKVEVTLVLSLISWAFNQKKKLISLLFYLLYI